MLAEAWCRTTAGGHSECQNEMVVRGTKKTKKKDDKQKTKITKEQNSTELNGNWNMTSLHHLHPLASLTLQVLQPGQWPGFRGPGGPGGPVPNPVPPGAF